MPLCGATSGLWGTNGERWSATSRLPDFSYAGYHCGEAPLPDIAPGVSVKNFGAKGDGVTDDTRAFLAALASVRSGAVEVPPGRYVITNILEIKRSGVVLRGARNVLEHPRPDAAEISAGGFRPGLDEFCRAANRFLLRKKIIGPLV